MALIIARALNLYCSALGLGIPAALVLVVLPPLICRERSAGERIGLVLRRSICLVWGALALDILSGAVWLLFEAAAMSGRGVAGAVSPAIIGTVLWQTNFGGILLTRFILTLALGCSLAVVPRVPTLRQRIAVLAGSGALGAGGFLAVAWSGHAAASANMFQLAADIVHLLATGLWLGGLVALAVLFGATTRTADCAWVDLVAAVTRRFFWLGIACVATLLATGIVNSWFLVGSVPALVGTDYGHLLLTKIALFGVMLGLAAVNHFRLTPGLASAVRQRAPAVAVPTIRSLRRNTVIEAALGVLVLGLVSSLGTVAPGMHAPSWWPFPWRPSFEAMELPEVRNEVMLASALVVVGVALCVLGIVRRRHRLIALPVGLALIAWFVPSFSLLTVQAYPTSFVRSAVAYTTDSIAQGGQLYVANCTSCHGVRAKGDGPAAADLTLAPADLTAAHVLDHTEGDIFWWLTAGIPQSGMPGFGDRMTENKRWDLVNWVRTMPVGGLDDGLTPEVGDEAAPRAPDFTFATASGVEDTLRNRLARGPLLLVLFTTPNSAPRLAQLAAAQGTLAASGLDTLALPLGGDGNATQPPEPGFVARADPSVAAVYRLIATARLDHEPPPAPHLEFLIDRDGYIRALWQPGEVGGWQDIATLIRQVHLLAERKLAPVPMPMDMHMHMG